MKGRMLAAAPIVIAQVLAMVSRFGMLVLAARVTTVEAFGTYNVVAAVLAWSGVLAMGGWPAYLLATIPKYGISREELRSVEFRLVAMAGALSIPQGLLLFVALGDSFSIEVAFAAGALLAGLTVGTVANEAHRATGRVLSSRLLFALVPPSVTMLTLGFLSLQFDSELSASLLVASVTLGWLALWASARRSLRTDLIPLADRGPDATTTSFSRRDFLLIKFAQAVVASADVFVVAMIAGVEASALYGVARRVATVAGLGLNAVTMLYGPRLSRAAVEPRVLKRLTRESTVLSAVLSVPLAVAIAVFAAPVLGVFGSDYKNASGVLAVMLIGVGISGICGPVGTVVHVNGQEAFSRKVMLLSAGAFVALLPVSVYSLGAVGGAACWSAITVISNLALWRGIDFEYGAR